MEIEIALENYIDAQAQLAHILLHHTAAYTDDALAGITALPVVTIKRLLAFAAAHMEARGGVCPEVYGEILRARPLDRGGEALCAAAEQGRWNVGTAHAAVKAHRPRRRVSPEQVESSMRAAETITGGRVTAESVLALDPVSRLELRKPLGTVARFAGQEEK